MVWESDTLGYTASSVKKNGLIEKKSQEEAGFLVPALRGSTV